MTTDPSAAPPAPVPATAGAPATAAPPASEPFALGELRACLWRPQLALDVVLVERSRLVASVLARRHLDALIAVLVLCGVVFAIPFGCVDSLRWCGHIATLFVGSVLLCFPSLQVFGAYLGLRLSMAQNLAIAMLIPAAAALFTFGFFPIHWFLQATMTDAASNRTIRVVLLTASLLLGLSHCNRCLFQNRDLRAFRASWPLWVGWQGLVLFISYRMAKALGLLG
jgi:hypothetical protein